MSDLFHDHDRKNQADADTRGEVKRHRVRVYIECVDCGFAVPASTQTFAVDHDGLAAIRAAATRACARCQIETRKPVPRTTP